MVRITTRSPCESKSVIIPPTLRRRYMPFIGTEWIRHVISQVSSVLKAQSGHLRELLNAGSRLSELMIEEIKYHQLDCRGSTSTPWPLGVDP
jgi:hypothetical protein